MRYFKLILSNTTSDSCLNRVSRTDPNHPIGRGSGARVKEAVLAMLIANWDRHGFKPVIIISKGRVFEHTVIRTSTDL